MQKWVWLGAGVVLGSMLSVYWPTEPAYAGSADSNQKLSICTAETQAAQAEAVFVLDHVTGRLTGAAYNSQTQGFNQAFFRSVAQDFGLTEAGVYVMAPGMVWIQGRVAGDPPANGGVYIAELTSGKVAMYGFPYSNRKGVTAPRELVPLATYDFREAQK